MTLVLTLQNDIDTIALNSSPSIVLNYVPEYSLSGVVTETIEILLRDTAVNMRAFVERIEKALVLADGYTRDRHGKRLWLLYQHASGMMPTLRSPVLRGRVELDRGTQRIGWTSKSVKLAIIIERESWWEETTDTAVPLTNGNATRTTSGINVYNCNDGSGTPPNKRHNYVEILGSDISGNIPGACRLEMTNKYNDSSRTYDIYVAQNVFAPSSLAHIIEGESTTFGSAISNSGCSGGAYRQLTWSGDSQVIIALYNLSSSFVSDAKGYYYKIFCRFASTPQSNTYLQAALTFPQNAPVTVLQQSPEVKLSLETLQEIGTMQIPPWLVGQSDLYPLDLTLRARRSGGGTLNIDYIMFCPLNGYRAYIPQGYGLAYDTRLVDDGIADALYTDGWTPSGKTSHYSAVGERLMLHPSVTQRLYFLQANGTGGSEITRVLNIKLYYRARYGTI